VKTTARSLQYLKRLPGVVDAGLVERHTPAFKPKSEGGGQIFGGRRHDLFGFIDIVAIDDGDGILGVQACGSSDLMAHQRKIEENPLVVAFLRRGNRLVLHGWRKRKVKRGGVAMRWSPRIVDAELAGDGISWHERADADPEGVTP
jgi:hypothetical protein